MSAVITISSPALASDGVTLTATLAGGTGAGYGPASAVTGVTVKCGGTAVQQTSAGVSGSTMTVVLAVPCAAADAMTVDVSAASNLTDSGANTALGQTGVSATNAGTVALTGFLMSLAAPYRVSNPDQWTVNASPVYYFSGKFNNELSFVVNGATGFFANLLQTGATWKVSVDGGAYQALPNPYTSANTLLNVSALAGTWDGAASHTVTFKHLSGSANTCLFNAVAGKFTFRATGSAPTVTADPNYSAAQYSPAGSVSAFVRQGEWVADTTVLNYIYSNFEGTVKFRTSAPRVRVWASDHPFRARLMVDGQDGPSLVSAGSDNVMRWQDFTGLDTGRVHEYALHVTGSDTNSCAFRSLMFIGGDLDAAPPAARPTLAALGDSITVGRDGTGLDASLGYLHQIGVALGCDVYNYAYDGATAGNMNDGTDARMTYCGVCPAHVERVLSISPAPAHVVWAYGHNDAFFGATPAQFIAAVTQSLNYLLLGTKNVAGTVIKSSPAAAGLPGLPATTVIHVLGLFPSTADTAKRDTWNAYLQQGIAACAAPGRVTFVRPDTWASGYSPAASTDSPDGTHPTAAGYEKLTPYIALELSKLYGRRPAAGPLAAGLR